MGMFGRSDGTIHHTFVADDKMTPVVKGIRRTMDQFKKDATQGFGLAAGISVWRTATRAIGEVTDYLGDAARAAIEDESSIKRLSAALDANVAGWDGNTDALEEYISSLGRLGFADDSVRESMALLVGATNDVAESQRILGVAMDLARFKGIDLKTASEALIKVEAGQYRILKSLGIELRANATSAEALAAVQAVAAGQAEAWSETTEGSMASMQIALDEVQESIGKALLPALKEMAEFVRDDVVPAIYDLMKVGGELGELFNNLNRIVNPDTAVIQDAAIAQEALRKELHLTTAEFAEFQKWFQPRMRMYDNEKTAAENLAQGIADMRADYQLWVREIARSTGTAVVVTGAWTGAFEGIGEAAGEGIRTMRRFADVTPTLMTHAVVDMQAAIEEGKDGIIEQMRDLAWQSKHPFAEVRYADWLAEKQRKAMRRSRQEARRGRPGIAAQYRQLAADIRAEMQGLPGYMASIAGLAMDALSIIPGFGWVNDDFTPPKSGGKGNRNGKGNRRPGDGPPTGKNALGGPVEAGGTYLVGEHGPELLHMGGNGGGSITSNARMGQPINVYVDGRRLFQITDVRNGRAIAMGG